MITGMRILKPERLTDARGFFSETYNFQRLFKDGIEEVFVQDNFSYSVAKGTLRGLHCQMPPFTQAKLVSCNRGTVFDVVVDARFHSPTFGQWHGEVLSRENGLQIYVPVGCLHGFVTMEEHTEVNYKCSEYYNKDSSRSVKFNDAEIGIEWPIKSDLCISRQDLNAVCFSEIRTVFEHLV